MNKNNNHFDTKVNVWQSIANSTNNIVTPANAIDAVAFVGAIYGIKNIDTSRGKAITLASYTADVIDGKVARATGTSSELGEAVDAAGDKLKLLYGMIKLRESGLLDKRLMKSILIQNTLNSAITVGDRFINKKPVVHPSKIGKRSFFLQELGVGLNVAGQALSKKGDNKIGVHLEKAGVAIGYAGVALGSVATMGYFKSLKSSRTRNNISATSLLLNTAR